MSVSKACQKCRGRDLSLKVAYCAGCGLKHRFCPVCWPTFTTCADDRCRQAAKEKMADFFKKPTPLVGKGPQKAPDGPLSGT